MHALVMVAAIAITTNTAPPRLLRRPMLLSIAPPFPPGAILVDSTPKAVDLATTIEHD